MLLIRKQTTKDDEIIHTVIKAAFEQAEHTDGNEHELVKALRKGEAFIKDLSLVAKIDGKIVGYILFTKAKVGRETVLALAPLAVLPDYQRSGIGLALINEGHNRARELGYDYSVVLGSETYYPKADYLPAATFGIKPPFEVPSENFMAYPLKEEVPKVCGTIKYAKEFGID